MINYLLIIEPIIQNFNMNKNILCLEKIDNKISLKGSLLFYFICAITSACIILKD